MVTSVLVLGVPEKALLTGMEFKNAAGDELTNGSDFCRDALDTVITGQKASP
jgi:hypothetical protein